MPGHLVRYPNGLAWPIALAAAAAVGIMVVLLRRRSGLRLRRLGLASLSLLAPMLAAPLAAAGIWGLLRAVHPGYADLLLGDTYRPGWARAGFVVLGLTACLSWYAGLRRRLGSVNLLPAGPAWLAVMGLLLAAVAPGASYLFALPALAAAGAGIVAVLVRQHRHASHWQPAAYSAAATVTALVVVPVIALLLPTLGLAGAAAPVLLVVLFATTGLALLECLVAAIARLPTRPPPLRRGWLGVPAAGTASVLLLFGISAAVDRFDEVHPRPAGLVYTLDADTGIARWLSADRAPSGWTAGFRDRRRLSRCPASGQTSPAGFWPATGPVQPRRRRCPPPSCLWWSRGRPEVGARSAAAAALTPWGAGGLGAPGCRRAHAGCGYCGHSGTAGGSGLGAGDPHRRWGWGFVIKAAPVEGIEVELQFATSARGPGGGRHDRWTGRPARLRAPPTRDWVQPGAHGPDLRGPHRHLLGRGYSAWLSAGGWRGADRCRPAHRYRADSPSTPAITA